MPKQSPSYVNQRFAPTNVQVFVEIFGNAGTLYWIADVESVAAMENLDNQLNAGPEYQALLAEGAGLLRGRQLPRHTPPPPVKRHRLEQAGISRAYSASAA